MTPSDRSVMRNVTLCHSDMPNINRLILCLTLYRLTQGKGQKLTYFLEGEDRSQRMRRISLGQTAMPQQDQVRHVSILDTGHKVKAAAMPNGMTKRLDRVAESSHPRGHDKQPTETADQPAVSSPPGASAVTVTEGPQVTPDRALPSLSSLLPTDKDASLRPRADDVIASSDVTDDAHAAATPVDADSGRPNSSPVSATPRVDASGLQRPLARGDSGDSSGEPHPDTCGEPSEMRCLLDDSRTKVTSTVRRGAHLQHRVTPESSL